VRRARVVQQRIVPYHAAVDIFPQERWPLPVAQNPAHAQFIAVCRRSKMVSMSTRRPRKGLRLCKRWARQRTGDTPLLPPVRKRTKTTGWEIGQGKFWANLPSRVAEKSSAPWEQCDSGLDWLGMFTHRPPMAMVILLGLGLWSVRNRSAWITPTER